MTASRRGTRGCAASGEIAAALKMPGLEKQLRARFDADEMTRLGIYPGAWDTTEDRSWLIGAFRKLREFYAAAGKAEHTVVTVIE